MDDQAISDAITEIDFLFTAQEAYPAFEKLCLSAKRRISASFHVFDLTTKLRSAEGLRVGETWFDLFLHRLEAGVDIDITVTDFDPIIATEDHRRSWSTGRQLAALSEVSSGGRLTFKIALHPARVGWVPRKVLSYKVKQELEASETDPLTPRLNRLSPHSDLPLVPATHHQKLAVIDEETVYIGGLDLNERRYDTPDHTQPTEGTWRDVQAIVRGPVASAAQRHIDTFLSICRGEAEAPPPAPGFLRTISTRRDLDLLHVSPKTLITEIEEAHLRAAKRASGLIYLETQFFRHKPLAEALVQAADAKKDLACILILPAAPEDVAFDDNDREDAQLGAQMQMECLDILEAGFGDRLAIAAPTKPVPSDAPDAPHSLEGAPLIYVHSKVSIFGSREAIVSSANLNGRSMRWDTEAGVHLVRPDHVTKLWRSVQTHWKLDNFPTDQAGNAPALVAAFNERLAQNAARSPEERTDFLLPYDRSHENALASPLFGVPDEMV